jgi:hypothetical protein|tara:strand:+ start:2058 stop:2375 length:318 start_codon:yes stop_codon:yes gene_type:complete
MDKATQKLVIKYGLDKEAKRMAHEERIEDMIYSAAERVIKTEEGKKAMGIMEKEGGFYYTNCHANKKLLKAKQILVEQIGEELGESVYRIWGSAIEHDLNNFYDI